ncbi:hypothetical protein EDEG_01047 [Edhazardia aedis USNM 41457]|uniref:Uncharacterized protein n=1 Tax=Edhazardia aedis (strain USNM 41457) TaxID=1003232 RepID=J9DTY3_EDHAE|nr:hypothetical protein EDEG_01047 [Edhazardia aedis USNM 41457]|eukprot:EJW04757.1 hypothetical protein EDEG_01047 [Edhazardia aedis USNM 41457]
MIWKKSKEKKTEIAVETSVSDKTENSKEILSSENSVFNNENIENVESKTKKFKKDETLGDKKNTKSPEELNKARKSEDGLEDVDVESVNLDISKNTEKKNENAQIQHVEPYFIDENTIQFNEHVLDVSNITIEFCEPPLTTIFNIKWDEENNQDEDLLLEDDDECFDLNEDEEDENQEVEDAENIEENDLESEKTEEEIENIETPITEVVENTDPDKTNSPDFETKEIFASEHKNEQAKPEIDGENNQ